MGGSSHTFRRETSWISPIFADFRDSPDAVVVAPSYGRPQPLAGGRCKTKEAGIGAAARFTSATRCDRLIHPKEEP